MDRFSAGTPTSACTPRRRMMAEVRILLASSLRCDTSFLNEDAEFFAVQASTGTSTSGLAHRSQPISITPLSTLLRPTPPSPTPSPENSVPFMFFAASFRLLSLVLPPCGTDHHPLPSRAPLWSSVHGRRVRSGCLQGCGGGKSSTPTLCPVGREFLKTL